MNKNFVRILVLSLCFVFMCGCGIEKPDEKNGPVANAKEAIYIGDVNILDYTLTGSGLGSGEAVEIVKEYIGKSLIDGDIPAGSGKDCFIKCVIDSGLTEGAYSITNGNVVISAPDKGRLIDEAYVFINTYLGWMYAGTENERISDQKTVLHIPDSYEYITPWMPEREAIVTLWDTSYVRGNSYIGNTSNRTNIMNYSDGELYEYVKMLKWCGFTGVQVTDICAAWTTTTGYRFVQDRLRDMADAAHSLDMTFTLWVWAANFDGFGWIDDEVTYDKGDYEFQYQNPDVVKTFDKYYRIYTELVDVTDRIICHFYDPGNLETADDVGFFANRFKNMVLEINPDIDFGISCWIDAFDIGTILSYTGPDVTLYEGNYQSEGGIDGTFRQRAYTLGARIGTWSWNTCGMETDQITSMYFNPSVISCTYHQMSQYDDIFKPEYWSEMDAYHILNSFSLYCAGHLLVDPEIGTDEITYEVAYSAVGPEYAAVFADVLGLIEDARTGENWETYWWGSDDYILKSDDYPTDRILSECNRLLPKLKEMASEGIEGYYMPTPVPMKEILELVIPHVEEIREFATFRKNFDKLVSEYSDESDKDKVYEELMEIAVPIHEYNTVIGTWGQVESRQQRIMVLDFCEENGIKVPIYPYYDAIRKTRIYDAICMQQRNYKEPFVTWTYAATLAYHTEERRLIDELIEDGRLTADDSVWFHVTNWQEFIYDF